MSHPRPNSANHAFQATPSLALPYVEAASATVGVQTPFWESDDERVLEEGMYQLAFELDVRDVDALLNQLPIGYTVVHDIFIWEQRRAMSGFSTSPNVGTTQIRLAADAYERVGMAGEAQALRCMLDQLERTPDDHKAIETAYQGVANPHRDDWHRFPALILVLVDGKNGYFYGVG